MKFGESLKSLLPAAAKSYLSAVIHPGSYRDEEDTFFAFKDLPSPAFTYSSLKDCLTAYEQCPPIAAIINRKAQALVNGRVKILNKDGVEAQSAIAKAVRALLSRPNPLQSFKQFEAQAYIFQQIAGYSAWIAVLPYDGAPIFEAKSIWNIPPFMLEIIESEKNYLQLDGINPIAKIIMTYKNRKTELRPDNVFIHKDFTPSCKSMVLPSSRILANQDPVNNIIAAYKSRGVLISSRGPMYVVSSAKADAGGSAMSPGEKKATQDQFKKAYGITREQSMAIITNAAVNVQTIGFSSRDLMLIEETQESTKALCDAYNYPAYLLGVIDSTYNNHATAEKGLYQNGIIPDSESMYEQMQAWMFGGIDYGIKIVKDFSHLPSLQENDLERAQARYARNQGCLIEWQNDIITQNQWRIFNGDPRIEGGDIYYSEWIKNNPHAKQNNNGLGFGQQGIESGTEPKKIGFTAN